MEIPVRNKTQIKVQDENIVSEKFQCRLPPTPEGIQDIEASSLSDRLGNTVQFWSIPALCYATSNPVETVFHHVMLHFLSSRGDVPICSPAWSEHFLGCGQCRTSNWGCTEQNIFSSWKHEATAKLLAREQRWHQLPWKRGVLNYLIASKQTNACFALCWIRDYKS